MPKSEVITFFTLYGELAKPKVILCGSLKNWGNGNAKKRNVEIGNHDDDDEKTQQFNLYKRGVVPSHLTRYMQDSSLKCITWIVSNFLKDNSASKKCVHWTQHMY